MRSWLHLAAYPAAYGVLFGTMQPRELTLHARPLFLYPVFGIVLMPTLYLFRWLRRGEGTVAEAIGALVLNSAGLIVFFTLAHWSGGLVGDDKPPFGKARCISAS